ncbi:MAG: fibronectin type III domain-containing protein [Patescibacteria group bacterium]|nr:fibronectin type III domain-containing protein [Patescibacteria group bacterium]
MKKLVPWIIMILCVAVAGGAIYWMVFKKDVSVESSVGVEIEAIRPKQMKISEIDSNSFTVEWTTQGRVLGYLKYGDTSNAPSLVAQEVGGTKLVTEHKVKVTDLIPGRKYYFWVMSDNIAFGRDGRALEVLTLSE